MKVDVASAQPINLVYSPRGNDGCIALAISRLGMKISSVALDTNLYLAADTRQNEVELKCSSSSCTIVLPPNLYVVGSDLLKFPKEDVFDRTVAGHDWDAPLFRSPPFEGGANITH